MIRFPPPGGAGFSTVLTRRAHLACLGPGMELRRPEVLVKVLPGRAWQPDLAIQRRHSLQRPGVVPPILLGSAPVRNLGQPQGLALWNYYSGA
jgi:hypothetical protein